MRNAPLSYYYEQRGEDDCWQWTGAKSSDGYGNYRSRGAHRVVYEALVAPIPAGLQIDHLCRNRLCVNPKHLEPVTPQINTLRSLSNAAANAKKTECQRGHPFTPDNTVIEAYGGRAHRRCRTCTKARLLGRDA